MVVGDRQLVDLRERPAPQPEQRRLRGPDQPALGQRHHGGDGDDDRGGGDAEAQHDATAVLVIADEAAVDDLLHEDGHGDAAEGGGGRSCDRQRQPAPQLRAGGEPAPQHGERALGIGDVVRIRTRPRAVEVLVEVGHGAGQDAGHSSTAPCE